MNHNVFTYKKLKIVQKESISHNEIGTFFSDITQVLIARYGNRPQINC